MTLSRRLTTLRNLIFTISLPIFLLPVLFVYKGKAGKCAYGILVIVGYWVTQALPIYITALLPPLIFPMLGIASINIIATHYFSATMFLAMSAVFIAIAMENVNLHKRLALKMLLLLGPQTHRLLLCFMTTTCFLSLWMGNMSVTTMMLPIALDVMNRLEMEPSQNGINTVDQVELNGEHILLPVVASVVSRSTERKKSPKNNRLATSIVLGICYSSAIGGMGTLTGTASTLITKANLEMIYGWNTNMTYLNWFIFGLPISFLTLVVAYIWMSLYTFGPRFVRFNRTDDVNRQQRLMKYFLREYEALGPFSFGEVNVILHQVMLIVLYLTRQASWGKLFPEGYINGSTAALIVVISLFISPTDLRFWESTLTGKPRPYRTLLNWEIVTTRFPWGIWILFGSGLSLAKLFQISGLAADMGSVLSCMVHLPPPVMVLSISTFTATITELLSNAAVVNLMTPVLAELSKIAHIHPLYAVLPMVVSSNFAYMMPTATAVGAIVFATGKVRLLDMIKVGFVMNILSLCVLQLAVNTWGYYIFDLGRIPDWASTYNAYNNMTNININETITYKSLQNN